MPQTKPFACIFLATCMAACFSCSQPQQHQDATPATAPTTDTTIAATATAPPPIADKNKLAGTWVRSDAPYNIVITEVLDNGNLKATYLNPRSINVAKAEWASANGVIEIYIEMRDANYPGSNYRLAYYPSRDVLTGKYFQAVEGATYDVEFTRVK